MSSGSFIQVYVKCPFYHTDDGKRRITCEGHITGSTTSTFFRKHEDFMKWVGEHCCREYEKCPVHTGAMEKYRQSF